MSTDTTPGTVNLAAYSNASLARWFGSREGYYEPGERVVFEAVASEMAGKSILDLGVGGGRTVPLLQAISQDYAAIDFSEQMVRRCRQLHPGANVAVGDARDLGAFATASKDLVVFSCAGIDCVSHDDRQLVLREIHRVLRPGGLLVFSTHNRHGDGYHEKPWGSRRELSQLKHMAGLALFLPINLANHLRYRKLAADGPGWSIRNAAFDHFRQVFHYTTVDGQVEELVAAGFEPSPSVYESGSGRRLGPGEDTDTWWLHLIARRDPD